MQQWLIKIIFKTEKKIFFLGYCVGAGHLTLSSTNFFITLVDKKCMFWLETFFHLLEYTGEQIPRKNETNI